MKITANEYGKSRTHEIPYYLNIAFSPVGVIQLLLV